MQPAASANPKTDFHPHWSSSACQGHLATQHATHTRTACFTLNRHKHAMPFTGTCARFTPGLVCHLCHLTSRSYPWPRNCTRALTHSDRHTCSSHELRTSHTVAAMNAHIHTLHAPRTMYAHIHTLHAPHTMHAHIHTLQVPRTMYAHIHTLHAPRTMYAHIHTLHAPRTSRLAAIMRSLNSSSLRRASNSFCVSKWCLVTCRWGACAVRTHKGVPVANTAGPSPG